MSRITEQREVLRDYQMAHSVTGALRDISANHLQQVRTQYERSVQFFRELSQVYAEVRRQAQQADIAEARQQRRGALSIAITSDKQFYGSLNDEVMDRFVQETGADDRAIVVGQTGRRYLKNHGVRRKRIRYVSFADEQPTSTEVQEIVTYSQHFTPVYVFYPQFKSVFRQPPQKTDITYTPEEASTDRREGATIEYIFEPEIPKMLSFFDTQIRSVLFRQIMLEVDVARTAARLMAMNRAEDRASDKVDEAYDTLQQEIAVLQTKQLLNTFAGVTQWN